MELPYRPKFCCNCGATVERLDWHPWTSGRFCEVCETEFKGYEIVPRIIVGVAGLFIAATTFAFISGGSKPQEARVVPLKQSTPAAKPANVAEPQPKQAQPAVANLAAASLSGAPAPQPNATPLVVADAAYMCGAETKKGTPCTRRVKGNVRCWQHAGMPSMIAGDKLKIS